MNLMNFVYIAIAIWLISWIIKTRNNFEELRRSVRRGASEIGIMKEHRANSLDDAMKIAKISHAREVEGISQLVGTEKLEGLRFIGERFPDLQNNINYTSAMEKSFQLNEQITAARRVLDGNIEMYDNAITSFPGLIVAAVFGYKKEKFIDEENEEQNRKLSHATVDFDKY